METYYLFGIGQNVFVYIQHVVMSFQRSAQPTKNSHCGPFAHMHYTMQYFVNWSPTLKGKTGKVKRQKKKS